MIIDRRKLLIRMCIVLKIVSTIVSQASVLPIAQNKTTHDVQEARMGMPLSPAMLLQEFNSNKPKKRSDRREFVTDLLRMLHGQYGKSNKDLEVANQEQDDDNDHDGQQDEKAPVKRQQDVIGNRGLVMTQLLNALNADGDISRLLDWVQNSFNMASVGELTTQFVVSKLGSVNCAALLKPDEEKTLVPRFLLFNEHFTDVPFEMSLSPSGRDCLAKGHFDPIRKTVLLLHGYLGGYTITDGLTNIKNRILDLNREVDLAAQRASFKGSFGNVTNEMSRIQKYNVIIVDWYNGANPIVRSNYIRAAVNAQVVGQLIARFLMGVVKNCQTSSDKIQIIAHSLGCHVAGFTGKSMIAAGHKLAKITHLDPVGLCFGRLFSEPRFRLNPSDAHLTQAVHVSLNIFDNPLDGVQENFMVNGGRDQLGCGGQSELRNSTASSVSILFDSEARFGPCSHMRALALFEEDLSSRPDQCQVVGYKCPTYDHFLAGRCGKCDDQNGQCRLMSLPALQPIEASNSNHIFHLGQQQQLVDIPQQLNIPQNYDYVPLTNRNSSIYKQKQNVTEQKQAAKELEGLQLTGLLENISNGSIAWVIDDKELNYKIGSTIAKLRPDILVDNDRLRQYTETLASENVHVLSLNERSDPVNRMQLGESMDKLKLDAKSVLAGWTNVIDMPKLSISSMLNSKATAEKLTSALLGGYKMLPEHLSQQVRLLANKSQEHQASFASPAAGQPTPLGGQQPPAGASNGPLYFVGTSSVSPYCVNYYQFRVLIAESRINSLLKKREQSSKLTADNKQRPIVNNLAAISQKLALPMGQNLQPPSSSNKQSTGSNMIHLSIKLNDVTGRFFKGFTLVEDARSLRKIPLESHFGHKLAGSENLLELTMLLNSTRPEPVRVSETVISYYFHSIILADSIQINYMSNISPEIRAKYSSTLCPLAINDKHQLVRYVECDRTSGAR